MSMIHASDTGEYAKFTGSPAFAMTGNTDKFTMAGWMKVNDITPDYWAYPFGVEDADDESGNWALIGYTNSNSAEFATTGESGEWSPAPSEGTWYYYYITGSNTGAGGIDFTAGYYTATGTSPVDTIAPTTRAEFDVARICVGNNSYGEWLGCEFAQVRVWTGVVLTDAQLRAERDSGIPVVTSGLFANWPLSHAIDLYDNYNTNHLTLNGTLGSGNYPPNDGVVQNGHNSLSSVTSISVTLDSAPTEGNLLVATHFTGSTNSIGPSGWTEAFSLTDSGNADQGAIYYKVAGSSESATITCTSDSSDENMLQVTEIVGPWPTDPLNAISKSSEPDYTDGTTGELSTGTTSSYSNAGSYAVAMYTARTTNNWTRPTNSYRQLCFKATDFKSMAASLKPLTTWETEESTLIHGDTTIVAMAGVAVFRRAELTVRQFNTFQGSTTAPTIAFADNVLSNSVIVANWNAYDTLETQPTITDSQTNSYTNQQTQNYDANDISGQAYAEGCSAGATTVTVTYDQNLWSTIVAVEIVGAKASGALHGSNETEAGTSSTTPTTNNVTTTVNDSIFIANLAHDSGDYTITEDSAFTLIFEEETQSSQMPISVIYRIVDTTVTESGSWTLSSSVTYGASVLVFEAEGGDFVSPIIPHFRIP